MKFPITDNAKRKAEEYANKSYGYVHAHDGFKDNRSKIAEQKRMVTGMFGQYILYDFCKINGIDVEEDDTRHTENDKFDLKIKGFFFDVKSTNSNIQCQINETSYRKLFEDPGTHCVFFVKFDKDFLFYEPLGFCTAQYYVDNSIEVQKGDGIPNTKFINKFNKTYVMRESLIQYRGLNSLIRLKHR